MAAIALYFGKVNMISHDIDDVINDRASFRRILENVIGVMNDGAKYTYDRPIKVDGEFTSEEIEYTLSIKEKNDSFIQGYIYKKSFIHYKDYNEYTKDLDSKKISNTEGVEFYYDVFREMIAYQRTQRFGYKEVLLAFEGIINNACENADLTYKFSLSQYTEGIDLDELKTELKAEPVQKINIKYQIPNPDADLLDAIRENQEKTIEEFEAANLTIKHVTYQSNSSEGLNIESDIILNELQNISGLHSKIDSKKAIQNGYVVVETTYVNGLTKSSADMRPVIKHIDEKMNFREEAERTILSRIAKQIREEQ